MPGSTLAIPHSCPPRSNKGFLGRTGKLSQGSQRHREYRHTGFRVVKKTYCPMRGTLTVWIDVLSRLLLWTLKSMAINIHLLLATQHRKSGKTLEHGFLNGNHGLWKSPCKYITGLVTQSACGVRYQKMFLKTCLHHLTPLSQSIHIISDPRMKNYLRKAEQEQKTVFLMRGTIRMRKTVESCMGSFVRNWLMVWGHLLPLGFGFHAWLIAGWTRAQLSLRRFQKTPTQPWSFAFLHLGTMSHNKTHPCSLLSGSQ